MSSAKPTSRNGNGTETHKPSRAAARMAFAQRHLGNSVKLSPASADASFRSYWRAKVGEKSWIVMDAPPPQEDCAPFVAVASRLSQAGIHTPDVIEQDLEQGFLLLEDLGDRLYSDELDYDTVDDLYTDASRALLAIAQADAKGLPLYDEHLLRQEMGLFPEWLLTTHLGMALDSSFYRDWTHACDFIVDSALAQPFVFVHRDFHCRNLMVVPDNNPGVIDFQDAVKGPVTYDAISLYRDCYVRWPRRKVESWLDQYRLALMDRGLVDVDHGTWTFWCDLMSVQRHLKAAGIFCRLLHRDGKDAYLGAIPRTLGYVAEICADHSTVAWLADLVDEILPQLADSEQ